MNEPCPCGSGKKFKRCHGQSNEPKAPKPSLPPGMGAAGMDPSQFDPSKLDPGAVAEMQKAMRRLPKGQLLRIQQLMSKAMAGKDVTREAQELERALPPDILKQMMSFSSGMGLGAGAGPAEADAPAGDDLSVDDARRIVEQAVADGKVSREEAEKLLGAGAGAASAPSGSGIGRLWKNITGKK